MKRNYLIIKEFVAGITCLCFIGLLYAGEAKAQSRLEQVLSEVEKNNKTLQARKQLWEAEKLLHKTGIWLSDPTISYDFMYGTPNAISGNQTDINFIQRFDFPASYKLRKALANEQSKESEFAIQHQRQSILLQAKTICIELVYQNKLKAFQAEKKLRIEKHLNDFEQKMNKGFGTILDVNKAKLLLLEINKDLQSTTSTIEQVKLRIIALNGGTPIYFNDIEYPVEAELPEFETIESEIEKTDPILKGMELQQVIAKKQIDVTKAMNLPKFDVGYHYQAVLGQKFNGGKIGMSIPLWENRNKLAQKQAELISSDVNLSEHKNEHYFEIKQHYEKYLNLKKTLSDYKSLLQTINSIELLDKALRLGEISTLQYFTEAELFNEAKASLLLTEKEYHAVTAFLTKYAL
jgi:outer membrane protein TolC